MRNQAPHTEASGAMPAGSGRRDGLGWADIVVSAFLVLVVAVPTLAIEEDWHGRPMIDQPNHLWVVAAGLVVAAFLFGGALAGYRRPSAAALNASAVALVAEGVLLVADVVRRLWLAHETISIGVAGRWCLGILAASLLSLAGSQLGRRIALHSS